MRFDEDKEVLQAFEEETRERLQSIEAGLLQMERNSASFGDAGVHAIFREAHSIKAGAGLLNMGEIEALAHRAETLLQRMRVGEQHPDSEVITVLLEAFDGVRDLLEFQMNGSQGTPPDITWRLAALERFL